MAFTRAFTSGTPPIGSDSSGTGATSQDTSGFGTFNLAAGLLCVVEVKAEQTGGAAMGPVTDTAGNTYTPLTQQYNAADNFACQLFYCLNTAANAANVWTVALPTGSTYRNICALPYNKSGTAAFLAESGNNTATASTTPNSAAISAGDLGIIVGLDFAGGNNGTAQAGDTEQYDVGTNGSHGFDRVSSPGGTWTPQFTIAVSTSWGIAGATFTDTVANALEEGEWIPQEPQTNPLNISVW
jgi:hypothetical protein